jgi:hypothetical protein
LTCHSLSLGLGGIPLAARLEPEEPWIADGDKFTKPFIDDEALNALAMDEDDIAHTHPGAEQREQLEMMIGKHGRSPRT